MMNENPQDIELARLRERVELLERQLAEQAREEQNIPQVPPPPPPVNPEEPGMGRRAMNFMYNVGNRHAMLRNFGWAMVDGVKAAGYIAGAAASAARATPAMLVKAKAAYAAALALAAANPIGAGVAGVVALAAAEKSTRYTDENGNTRHQCAIM